MGLFPSSGWFVCCSFWSWSCSAGPVCVHLDRRHRSRGRLPCIIMEDQEAVVSLVLSGHNVFFQGGRRQSPGKSVVMRTLRNARSIAANDDGKTFAATFYHCTATGLARGSATLIAGQVLANDEASEPTLIRKTRVLLVDRTVDEVSWWALHVWRRLDFIARVGRDRCVPFGDMQVVFAGDFFRFPPVPNAEDDRWFSFRSSLWPVIIPASHCAWSWWCCPRSIARKTYRFPQSFQGSMG